MDKNTLVGFALIGAVLIGFSIYNRPSQEEMERAQRYRDSIQTIELQEAAKREAEAAAQSVQTLTLDSTSLFFGANQGTEQFTTLENNLVKVTFSNKGGRVVSATLKEYNNQQGEPLTLFNEEESAMNFAFEGKNENILTEDLFFQPMNVTDSTVTMPFKYGRVRVTLSNLTFGPLDCMMAVVFPPGISNTRRILATTPT